MNSTCISKMCTLLYMYIYIVLLLDLILDIVSLSRDLWWYHLGNILQWFRYHWRRFDCWYKKI